MITRVEAHRGIQSQIELPLETSFAVGSSSTTLRQYGIREIRAKETFHLVTFPLRVQTFFCAVVEVEDEIPNFLHFISIHARTLVSKIVR